MLHSLQYRYLYLCERFLIENANRYDVKGKKYIFVEWKQFAFLTLRLHRVAVEFGVEEAAGAEQVAQDAD